MDRAEETDRFQADLVAWAHKWRVPKSHVLAAIDALMEQYVFSGTPALDRPDRVPEAAWPELVELIERFWILRHL